MNWTRAVKSPLPPTLYHRYARHVYRITIMPGGIEVQRLESNLAPAAKSISFEAGPRLRTGKSWNSSVAEKLIDRYEHQLVAEQEKPTP